tara:strand:- start:48 stop:290 length:243 start_codon:yes stop_codon:yes gene_type:complete
MAGPFKMKGWSPFTKKSPAKTEGHGGAEDHTHPKTTSDTVPSDQEVQDYYDTGANKEKVEAYYRKLDADAIAAAAKPKQT